MTATSSGHRRFFVHDDDEDNLDLSGDAESPLEDDLKDGNANKTQNADPEYKHLIAICARKRKGGIKYWFYDDPSSATRISLREHNLVHAVINHGAEVIRGIYKRPLWLMQPAGVAGP